MTPHVISMGGAAFLASHILSFNTKAEWVKDCMASRHTAFIDKMPDVRKKLFGEMYDLAKKHPGNGDSGGPDRES